VSFQDLVNIYDINIFTCDSQQVTERYINILIVLWQITHTCNLMLDSDNNATFTCDLITAHHKLLSATHKGLLGAVGRVHGKP